MYSDSDENNSNEFSYNFSNMSVIAKGPNLATYRNNNFTKAMKMSRDFGHSERTRYVYDSRSVNNRRDSSPKSIRSVCDFQPRSFNFSTSSQSVYNFQNRNPGGLPSYVTATDIALSLQNNTFNHLDLKILQKAIRCFQNRFLENSGEQGSNSSLSNDDDNRSTRSSIFKENMSSYKSTYSSSSRLSRQKRLYNGSHNSRQQNHVRNAHALKVDNLPNNFQSGTVNAQPLQKDRFKNRHLLPSQRFNKALAASVITENIPTIEPTVKNAEQKNNNNNNNDTVPNKTSENNNEIFSNITVENNNKKAKLSCKRKLEENTAILSNKKSKLSPIKKISDNLTVTESAEIIDKDETDDFSFVKPSFPIRKSCKAQNKKTVINECAKTSVHVAPTSQLESPNSHNVNESVDKNLCEPTENSTCDLSNRPSFMKRKLFTQKLDVAENKNISFDNVNSPIRASSQIQKEKNKTRKLVSNLSCLNRDDTQDTNYLELIHKIVPPNQINSTSQRNKTVENKEEDVNKWDVTSVVSECHSKDGSNTYTDEEIFEHNSTESTNQNKSKKRKLSKDCHGVLENSHTINSNSNIICTTTNEQEKEKILEPKGNNAIKSIITSDRFWDTDMESDVEDRNKQKKFPEPLIKDKVSDNKTKTNIRNNNSNDNDLENHTKSQETQKKIPESKNNDKMSGKTKLQVCANNFWDTDFESDFESPKDVQKKIPECSNKDETSDKCQNNEESTSKQLTKSNVDNNNHTLKTLTADNVSVCSSTSNNNNNKGKLNARNYKIRSHRESKKIKCCTTDLKVPAITIPGAKSNSKFKDNCTTDNDKVNNNQAEDKQNSKRKDQNIKTSFQICKSKQTEELKAKKCVNKTSVPMLKSQTKPNTNVISHYTSRIVDRRQTKQKTMSKKVLESPEYESDLSFSLLDSSMLTRSRTRAISKLINDSTTGNTDKSILQSNNKENVVSKGKNSKK